MTTRTLEINFEAGDGIYLGWSWHPDMPHCVSEGQTWDGETVVDATSDNGINVSVRSGLKGSELCAKWFDDQFTDDNLIHTLGKGGDPHKLNFAIRALLTINGNEMDLIFASGHRHKGVANNWWLGSAAIDKDNNVTLAGGVYKVSAHGSHTFKFENS